MSDAPLHEDNDTPKAVDADVKRCDADTPFHPINAPGPANVHGAAKPAS